MGKRAGWVTRQLAEGVSRAWLSLRAQVHAACGRRILATIKHKGSGCRIYGPVEVMSGVNLRLGDRVRIGAGCRLSAYGGLKIGDNTSLAPDVTIYTSNHNIEGQTLPYDATSTSKPVVIGRHVWIGARVCIAPGVTIGDGAVIGIGTVVSKDVPPGAIVVGSPMRVVRYRDMDHFDRLDKENCYLVSEDGFDKPPRVDFSALPETSPGGFESTGARKDDAPPDNPRITPG